MGWREDLEDFLVELEPELEERCRYLLRTDQHLGRSGTSGADLCRDAILLAVERAPRFLAQPTRRSRRAQIWALLDFTLHDAIRAARRRAIRERAVSHAPAAGAACAGQPRVDCPGPDDLRKLTPPQRLIVFFVIEPMLVRIDDVRAAAAFRRGGHRLSRGPVATFELVVHARSTGAAARDPRGAIADILYTDAPPGEADPGQRRRARERVKKQLREACRRLGTGRLG